MMRSTLDSRVNELFSRHRAAHAGVANYEADRQIRDQSSLNQFVSLRNGVIWSVMHRFSCFISDRFYQSTVNSDDLRTDSLGRKPYRYGATLRVYKGATLSDKLGSIPHYSAVWDEANGVVRFYMNKAGDDPAGDYRYDGKAALHDISVDLLEGKLLGFTNALMIRG